MRLCSALVILLACGIAQGDLLYSIGNSLTADARPGAIGPEVGYHIDYGDSLSTIHANPAGNGTTSVRPDRWDAALSEHQYDFLSVQPYASSNPANDAAAIADWARMQPESTVVLHSPWPHVPDNGPGMLARFERAYHGYMNSGDAALMSELREMFPGRQFRQTHSLDALHSIAEDVVAGVAPVDLSDIYDSDFLHMSDMGDYLMHNLMRGAIGLPTAHWSQLGIAGEKVDPQVWNYLDSKVAQFQPVSAAAAPSAAAAAPAAIPEPSSLLLLALVGLAYATWHYRQRLRPAAQ